MLLAYSDKLTVDPGETLEIKMSGRGEVSATLVRLHGLQDGAALRVREELIGDRSVHQARQQGLCPGSYVEIEVAGQDWSERTEISLSLCPTKTDTPQRVVQLGDLCLDLVEGQLVLGQGDTRETVSAPLSLGRWHNLRLQIEGQTVRAGLAGRLVEAALNGPLAGARVLIGQSEDRLLPLNGRVAEVRCTVGGTPLFDLDFSEAMGGAVAVDTSGRENHGVLHQRPARAVLGPHWDRQTLRWTDDPGQWNAVHLHEDDLYDAGWETDFSIEAPADSGIYAVKLEQDGDAFFVPFYVRPTTPSARVLFVAPTNTYLAYANEHLWEGERGETHQRLKADPIRLDTAEELLQDEPRLGRSLYDRHADGSGVMHASRLRPLTNLQPNHWNWLSSGPRHFSADFFITGWLEKAGVRFDVTTEQDLDERGLELLKHYDVVVSGSHPEYPTEAILDAIEGYIHAGGRFMYMGANGFFWVTDFLDGGRDAIEVRRGYAAQRNWTSHPAEVHQATTGKQGAAWRHRGRDQNPVFGIGMAAAGWGRASGYQRTEASYAPEASWAFEGIEGELIGAHGYLLGGAAGDEMDHADPARGTPDGTIVLMSSRHEDLFFPTLDAVTEVGPGQAGPTNPAVRADCVLVRHEAGGEVFSTGSICWAGSLGTNDYDNDVARLSTNVLRRFLENRRSEQRSAKE